MSEYTAISFAPVQGFIEKSRKLRDLYGASSILSYLSQKIVNKAENTSTVEKIISPALIHVQKGIPNRILVKGTFSANDTRNSLLDAWQEVLKECREWIERKVLAQYNWESEWTRWGLYTWEIFWGHGDTLQEALNDLETRKLRRDWTGINWMGDSSSLTGTDAIAWPGLGRDNSNPGLAFSKLEKKEIEKFYENLAKVSEGIALDENQIPEGKFIAPNERLSIPELVKRLITHPEIAKRIKIEPLAEKFNDISEVRFQQDPSSRHWTGWFMGDGDKVGENLRNIMREKGEDRLTEFSAKMRNWGVNLMRDFPKNLGRIVYAGGDDFLGVIYNTKQEVKARQALEWLMTLPEIWKEHGQELTVSVGFVWAAPNVPQRDILQHCREAEKKAKSLGRNRVTIRIVFNSGQYVEWTCPWDYLDILKKYRDRDRKRWLQNPNWTHVYQDLAHLKARHAIEPRGLKEQIDESIALNLFDLYFPDQGKYLSANERKIVCDRDDMDNLKLVQWIDGLINIGWQLCSNT